MRKLNNRIGKSNVSHSLRNVAAKSELTEVQIGIVCRWLAEQLVSHAYAKLSEGGHKQSQIPLGEVFVDLPVNHNPNSYKGVGDFYFLDNMRRQDLLDLGALFKKHKDSSSARSDAAEGEREEERYDGIRYAHYFHDKPSAQLIIGGPGQGKSTIGQLACQIHRAELLEPEINNLSQAQKDLVQSFSGGAASGDGHKEFLLEKRSQGLFPIQIALPDFAAWIHDKKDKFSRHESALLYFVSALPSAKAVGISYELMLKMISGMPVLLFLDGFDEVGASEDRAIIITAIHDLLHMLGVKGAKAKIIATTRPQGYANEFSKIGFVEFREVYLCPLDRQEALKYANKLIKAKIPGADNQVRAYKQICEAAEDPATERLLTTPLQVTIMAALIQQLGRAPRERWNLFSRYFSTTYDREIERGTYASRLIADYRSHIERIHARVGLLLQVEAEHQGGASARMQRERLIEVIRSVLEEDEVSYDEDELVIEIAKAAENRLVFLVEAEPGKFGFEIRSLQEFMAAWALTSGRDIDVEARLQQIVKAPMFKNVALFIVSRWFSEASPLRDILADTICLELDKDPRDDASRTAMLGAQLALEILEEGAALSQPRRARSLMIRAVELLSLPPSDIHLRLVRVADADTIQHLQSTLDLILNGGNNVYCQDSAWLCLIDAANRNEDWAIGLGNKYWSVDYITTRLIRIAGQLQLKNGEWLYKKIEQSLKGRKLKLFFECNVFLYGRGEYNGGTWVNWILGILGHSFHWGFFGRSGVGHIFPDNGCEKRQKPSYPCPEGDEWAIWIAIADYEVNPCAHSLATVLSLIIQTSDIESWCASDIKFSWPLESCLLFVKTKDQLKSIVAQLLSGVLGDHEDWIRSQENWKGKVRPKLILDDLDGDSPWSVSNINSSPPFSSISSWHISQRSFWKEDKKFKLDFLSQSNRLFFEARSDFLRKRLADLCIKYWAVLTRKDVERYDPIHWIESCSIGVIFLVPKPKSISVNFWNELLLSFRESISEVHPLVLSSQDVVESLGLLPKNKVLARLVVKFFVSHFKDGYLHPKIDFSNLDRLCEKYSNEWADLPLAVRADAGLLCVLTGKLKPGSDDELISLISKNSEVNNDSWDDFLVLLKVSRLPRIRIEYLLLRAFVVIISSDIRLGGVVSLIRRKLQERSSELDVQKNWDRLSLSLPYPKILHQENQPSNISIEPVVIVKIELKDICGIRHISINFPQPQQDKGQWIVIIGPNGVGKTTVLRSIALALRNVSNPSIWPKGAFSVAWRRVCDTDNSVIENSVISVTLSDGIERRTILRMIDKQAVNVVQVPEQQEPSVVPVFAYGCRRGSALGGKSRQVNLDDDSGPEISTLFDEGADLIQAETWIVALEGDVAKNDNSRIIYNAVISGLKSLLCVSEIFVEDQKLWALDGVGIKVHFSSLSDGYLTYAGWFLDLVARWINYSTKAGYILDNNFLDRMRGLVLIDEIDLHLHPQWQTEVIARTRSLMPRMSFVVTTHNPLTLVGAQAEEIHVLENLNGSLAVNSGSQSGGSPMFLTGGQLYKKFFGLSDIFPKVVGRRLQRFGYLSGNPLRTDDEDLELISIQASLQEEGIDPGWEIVPRVFFDN